MGELILIIIVQPVDLILQVGDPDHHQPQVPRHDPVQLPGQVPHRLEADPRGRPVRSPAEEAARTLPLRVRRRPLLRR